LVPKGCRLTSRCLSLLAAAGVGRISAGRQPGVAILATGSELAEAPAELQPGQIYESNRIGLAALAQKAGASPNVLPLVPDELLATRSALSAALESCDVLVTSGGVSVGEMDYVKEAFEALGGGLDFWRVAIKPGKPFVFGRLGRKLLFGLPGNPVSALVTFSLLVRPALLRWQGAANSGFPTMSGQLAEALVNKGERRHFMRVRVEGGQVFSAGLQASHALGSLAAASGLVDVPPETVLEPGTRVTVLLWD
jgi:molybdopterin molybdotransferase